MSSVFAATTAQLAAHQDNGFGRLVFSFSKMPKVEARISNGILVVQFSEAVNVGLEPAARGLPRYIAAARRDPDGAGVRFALTQRVKLNVLEAGERLFVDLLPENWSGMPPGLPADVLAELNRRLHEAGSAKPAPLPEPPKLLALHTGGRPGMVRLSFQFSDPSRMEFRAEDNEGMVTVSAPASAPVSFDLAAARAALPDIVTDLDVDDGPGAFTVRFRYPEHYRAQAFREGDTLVVDLEIPTPSRGGESGDPVRALTEESRNSEEAVALLRPMPLPVPRPSDRSGVTAAMSVADEQAPGRSAPDIRTSIAGDGDVATQSSKDTLPASVSSADNPAVAPLSTRANLTLSETPGSLHVTLPAQADAGLAVFSRGLYVWLVSDSSLEWPLVQFADHMGSRVRSAERLRLESGQAIRMLMSAPSLVSVQRSNDDWTVSIGDRVQGSTAPTNVFRKFSEDGRSIIRANLPQAGKVHSIEDPANGDRLTVVTTRTPFSGVARARVYVDFRMLPTSQGIAILAHADDVTVQAGIDEVIVKRDGGLTVSSTADVDRLSEPVTQRAGGAGSGLFDTAFWSTAQALPAYETARDLLYKAATSAPAHRLNALLALARFHLVHGNSIDAAAVLARARAEGTEVASTEASIPLLLLEAAASIGMSRYETALHTLLDPSLVLEPEAAFWRALALNKLGRFGEARQAIQNAEPILADAPTKLRRLGRIAAVEAALGAGDQAGAAAGLDLVETAVAGPEALELDLLRGRLAEAMGQSAQALALYQDVTASWPSASAADARLRTIQLRERQNELPLADALKQLETLTALWRGDAVEAEALAALTEFYAKAHRWRDAFATQRIAVQSFPEAESTRRISEEMSEAFTALFVDGDRRMSSLETATLFYEFKELTPPGRRGDELIRGLADRLVAADLLDQASELLEYQIENRLVGAARAQIAPRLALIHLLNRKPAKAYRVLQSTRIAGLPLDLQRNRRMLEARALSELARPERALEMIDGLDGRDAERLRADILWSAKNWQPAAEALERLAGGAWHEGNPLAAPLRADILRAGIAYALAGDAIGLDRLRAKFAVKMAASPDGRAFDVVSAPSIAQGAAFQNVARSVSTVDTMQAFLAEYRRRYPDSAGLSNGNNAGVPRAQPATDGSAKNEAPKQAPATAEAMTRR